MHEKTSDVINDTMKLTKPSSKILPSSKYICGFSSRAIEQSNNDNIKHIIAKSVAVQIIFFSMVFSCKNYPPLLHNLKLL